MRVWLGYTEMETAGPSAPVGMTRGEWVFQPSPFDKLRAGSPGLCLRVVDCCYSIKRQTRFHWEQGWMRPN